MIEPTVILTGAAGFIGSVTARHLLLDGWRVIGVDNLNDYYDPRLKHHRLLEFQNNERFVFEKGDIEDQSFVNDLFARHTPHAVVNLAARAGVRYSLVDPHVYLSTNALGTLNILEAMRLHGVEKIVHASTSSLYAGQPMPFSEELPVNRPISPYAATKKASEMLCYSWHHLYDIDVSVVRYFTVFGPAGRPDMSIYRFITWIIEGTPLTLTGDGEQSRDFTFVDDIAAGTVAALKRTGYEVINLGGGRNPKSMKSVISTLEEILGKKAYIHHVPMPKEDMQSTWADISKAERLLGWRPEVSLRQGLEKTVEWHLDMRDLVASMNGPAGSD